MSKRIFCALLLLAVLARFACSGAADEGTPYRVEENPEDNGQRFPYRVVTDSAVLYLAQEDIDLLGEEAFYDGLYRLLENMEDDFAEAREVLGDYMKEDIPPVVIRTNFSGTGDAQVFKAYYEPNFGIRLFFDWDKAAASLLHEYVHYLTMDHFAYGVRGGFWTEGVAEYVSLLACTNRMARSVNYGLDRDTFSGLLLNLDGSINTRWVVQISSAAWDRPFMIGERYTAVCGITMTMTRRIQEHPTMDLLTYGQAACFLDYLVRHYGMEKVFTHMTYDEKRFRGLYGKTFEELCLDSKKEARVLYTLLGYTLLEE